MSDESQRKSNVIKRNQQEQWRRENKKRSSPDAPSDDNDPSGTTGEDDIPPEDERQYPQNDEDISSPDAPSDDNDPSGTTGKDDRSEDERDEGHSSSLVSLISALTNNAIFWLNGAILCLFGLVHTVFFSGFPARTAREYLMGLTLYPLVTICWLSIYRIIKGEYKQPSLWQELRQLLLYCTVGASYGFVASTAVIGFVAGVSERWDFLELIEANTVFLVAFGAFTGVLAARVRWTRGT